MNQIHSIILAAGLAIGMASVADAQNALDKNLQQGSGGINPAKRTIAEDLRIRNAIVTGNAPNGASFRGDVGYRAPGEFQGHLGSNDTFAFRRDSIGSGLAGAGIRGTEGLQYQFGASTGVAGAGQSGLGSVLVQRSGTAPSVGDIRQAEQLGIPRLPVLSGPGHTLEAEPPIVQETRGLSLLSLRSPSAYTANRGFVPSVIATSQTASGESWALTASPLRGVVYRPMADDQPGGNVQNPVTKPGETLAEKPVNPNAGAQKSVNDRLDTSLDTRSGLNEIEMRIDSRLGVEKKPEEPTTETKPDSAPAIPGSPSDTSKSSAIPGGLKPWRERLADLRKDLSEDQTARIAPKPKKADDDLKARSPADADQNGDTKDADNAKDSDDRTSRRGVSKASKELIRSAAGEPLQRYAPEGFDAYAENMARAQEHMAAGRYFDAEQRFVAAGSSKGGDAMAAVGRVNSQIGAGTFTSAAMSLRSVFSAHPEIIAVRYDAKIMPTSQRLTSATDRLREIITQDRAGARDPALVLAYIGYQTGNVAQTREGLDALDASLAAGQPGGIAPNDANSRLADLLRDVWLNPGVAPAQNSPAK